MHTLPSPPIMYKALLRRSTAFEGIFFVGVRTTGIFCRPTCPAKKPRLENVEFFASPQEALYAGYRPCSRCHPMDHEKRLPQLVLQLREAVEKAPTGRLKDSELRAMGIDPSTARRQFLRYYGMTFHAYHRARRMGLALHEVRNGEAVVGAQLNHGFESSSGFWEAFKRVFGTPPSKAEQVNCLFARWIETSLGAMLVLANKDGLHLLEFVDRRGLEKEILTLRKRLKCAVVPGTNPHLERIERELKAYFGGSSTRFSVPLVMTGSEFERRVWKFLQTIPSGKTWSYAQLAKKLGNANATRAIGRATGRNCLALVIPCHRVIRADGTLCGYGGGIWRKQWLLNHEREVLEQSSGRKLDRVDEKLQTSTV